MALHGLVTRNMGTHVKHLRLHGEWRQPDLEEHGRLGLVPDSDIMLSCLVRVALEKMPSIQSFRYIPTSSPSTVAMHAGLTKTFSTHSWELDTKMLPTVWQGLAQSTVADLTVKFPTLRTPRPIALVPPMPNLKSLRLLDIDPLCYVDDVSLLIAKSSKLESLSLVWHPRMKEMREPSVSLSTFFGRSLSAVPPIPLKRVAIKNLYSRNDGECNSDAPKISLQEMTMINSTTGQGDEAGFFEASWRSKRHRPAPDLKLLRGDNVSRDSCTFLASISGLEYLYLVCPFSNPPSSPATSSQPTALPNSPASSNDGTPSSAGPSSPSTILSLKDTYIETILTHHGPTLKHLLLLPQWRLAADDIVKIFHGCPNLEQLGIGVEFENWPNLRLLAPFMVKLKALRLLDNPLDNGAFRAQVHAMDVDHQHEKHLGRQQLNREKTSLRWIELADLLFQLGVPYPCEAEDGSGSKIYKRKVTKRSRSLVEDLEIWKYSTMEV